MAHSLFEPAPLPLAEKLWRRVKGLHIEEDADATREVHTDPRLLQQANMLDARGQQDLLKAVLTTKPIK